MIKIKELTLQEWIPIKEIDKEGFIKLKNNKLIKILKIKPINYNLKSDLEKESILNSYKIFLKTCNFDIQIIIQSQKEDLFEHISMMEKRKTEEEENIKEIINKYIESIQKLNSSNKSDSKQFFILINQIQNNNKEDICINQLNDKYFKVKEALSRCGNHVYSISTKEEAKEILGKYFCIKNIFNGGGDK